MRGDTFDVYLVSYLHMGLQSTNEETLRCSK